jgi:hypothetical protein
VRNLRRGTWWPTPTPRESTTRRSLRKKHIIKRDEFKGDSEDTADEEVMMQDEAPKHQEIGKEELASAVDITEVTGTKAEIQEGESEDIIEVDVVMVRYTLRQGQMEHCRKSMGWRLTNAEHDLDRRKSTGAAMLKNNPDGNHDEVDVLRERVKLSVLEDRFDRDAVADGDDEDRKTAGKYVHKKPKMRGVMIKNNSNGKNDEAEQLLKILWYKLIGDKQNLHGDDDDHDVSNVENLSRQSERTLMGELVTKLLGDTAYETILDKDPGKDKVHDEPEVNHKAKYDKNNAVKNQMYVKPEPKDGMLKNNFKYVIKSLGETVFKNLPDKNCGKQGL